MTAPHCTLVTAGSVPRVVEQALEDRSLSPTARLTMWYLARHWLDLFEYREVKSVALAVQMGVEDQTAGKALRTLVQRGYLDEHPTRKPRALRMPWTRRASVARAA